jgi:hypothetical protein
LMERYNTFRVSHRAPFRDDIYSAHRCLHISRTWQNSPSWEVFPSGIDCCHTSW